MVSAEQIHHELQFFLPDITIRTFPDWETLIYDSFSPHQDIISERLEILNQLSLLQTGVIIIPANTIMQKLLLHISSLAAVCCWKSARI